MALDRTKFNSLFNKLGSHFTIADDVPLPPRKACALCAPMTSGSTVIPGYSRPANLAVVGLGGTCPTVVKSNTTANVPLTPIGMTHWATCYTTMTSGSVYNSLQISMASGTKPPTSPSPTVWVKVGPSGS